MRRRAIPLIALVLLMPPAIVWGIGLWVARTDGFSAREEPRILERMMARTARRWAVPAAARRAVNPIAFSPDVWVAGRAHFADHCASCHANDGGGDTELGRNMFPRAPDMRAAGHAESDRRGNLLGHRQRHPPDGQCRPGSWRARRCRYMEAGAFHQAAQGLDGRRPQDHEGAEPQIARGIRRGTRGRAVSCRRNARGPGTKRTPSRLE